MQSQDHIRQFIRENLGCGCPDEVLEAIECTQASADFPAHKLDVGGRLLIYIMSCADETDLTAALRAAFERGVAERNAGGFNRFRLVLAAGRPDEVRGLAEQAVAACSCNDGKAHLHVLDAQSVAGLFA